MDLDDDDDDYLSEVGPPSKRNATPQHPFPTIHAVHAEADRTAASTYLKAQQQASPSSHSLHANQPKIGKELQTSHPMSAPPLQQTLQLHQVMAPDQVSQAPSGPPVQRELAYKGQLQTTAQEEVQLMLLETQVEQLQHDMLGANSHSASGYLSMLQTGDESRTDMSTTNSSGTRITQSPATIITVGDGTSASPVTAFVEKQTDKFLDDVVQQYALVEEVLAVAIDKMRDMKLSVSNITP